MNLLEHRRYGGVHRDPDFVDSDFVAQWRCQ
jgi:hypothetical protein